MGSAPLAADARMHEAAMDNFVGAYLDVYGLTETRRMFSASVMRWRVDGWQNRVAAPPYPGGNRQRQLRSAA